MSSGSNFFCKFLIKPLLGQGDSGGGLMFDNVLVGVVSWGEDCALKHFPGVYAKVSYVRDWIKEMSGV